MRFVTLVCACALGLTVLESPHLGAAPSTADLFRRYIEAPGRVAPELG